MTKDEARERARELLQLAVPCGPNICAYEKGCTCFERIKTALLTTWDQAKEGAAKVALAVPTPGHYDAREEHIWIMACIACRDAIRAQKIEGERK